MMDRDSLLAELEPLTHDARNRRMVELGRLVAQGDISSAEIAQTLDTLEQGGFYERRLCLMSCFTSRDSARVVRSLADPSYMLRSLAWRLVAVVCDDDTLHPILVAASERDEKLLLRRLRRRARYSAVDQYLRSLAESDVALFDRYLHFGSREFVTAHLKESLLRESNKDVWHMLVLLQHYDIQAIEMLQRRAVETQSFHWRMVVVLNALLLNFSLRSRKHDFTPFLELIFLMEKHTPLTKYQLSLLVKCAPAAAVDFMIAGRELGDTRFGISELARLDETRFKWLLDNYFSSLELREMNVLPEASRIAVYQKLGEVWRQSDA